VKPGIPGVVSVIAVYSSRDPVPDAAGPGPTEIPVAERQTDHRHLASEGDPVILSRTSETLRALS
jgi:hypothetical protein